MTLSIHERAAHYGSRTAVIDRGPDGTDETLTYDQLAAMAAACEHRLADANVSASDAVCVVSRNRPELLALFFATLECDTILAPISHRLPAETVATLRERIDPALTLYDAPFADLFEGESGGRTNVSNGGEVASLESFLPEAPDSGPRSLSERSGAGRNGESVDPERPVLYLHTGGTTGVPKVVVCPYRQLEWNCLTEVAAWGLGKTDVSPILLPMFHTGGWNLLTLPTLYVGGRVVLHREFDPALALDSIERYEGTHVFGVAAIFEAMAGVEAFGETDLSSLDWVMSGGGPTPESVIDTYRERGLRFTQGYGLTEGGPNNLYFDPDRLDADGLDADADEKAAESVGRPFPDCEVRIVDQDGTELEEGETGELEIAGPMTATGYLETEDGTFGSGWVSTGDLAHRDAAGDYYITGRTDNMFVSGGENVYPEPIEATLEGHPAVAEVAIVPIPHERWGQVPKAVVVTEDGDELDPEELESSAREELADHEIPKAIEFVETLPRSGPGKLDRGALESRFGEGSEERGGDAE